MAVIATVKLGTESSPKIDVLFRDDPHLHLLHLLPKTEAQKYDFQFLGLRCYSQLHIAPTERKTGERKREEKKTTYP